MVEKIVKTVIVNTADQFRNLTKEGKSHLIEHNKSQALDKQATYTDRLDIVTALDTCSIAMKRAKNAYDTLRCQQSITLNEDYKKQQNVLSTLGRQKAEINKKHQTMDEIEWTEKITHKEAQIKK